MSALVTTGAIGLDIQPSHATVVEWDGTTPGAARAVGDGVRRVVPHALAPTGEWASAAAPACVLPAEVGSLDELMPWRTDPWAVPFLRGLADRLGRYIGLPAATHRYGYHLWVVGDDTADQRAALEAAGLPDVTFVDPVDAVLAEWAAGGAQGVAADAEFRGPVVVVACGEETSFVDAFQVDGHGKPRVVRVPGARSRVPHGIGAVRLRMAAEVLRRRAHLDRPVNVPALLGAVTEYAQVLAAGPRSWSAGSAVEWDGPLAEQMPAPLALSQDDLDAFPQTRTLVQELRTAVYRAGRAAGGERDAVLLLGGAGAGWGSLRAVAESARATAVSADPEQSLAAGACFWSAARWLTRDVWRGQAEPVAADAGADLPRGPSARREAVLSRRDRRVPDWMATPSSVR